MKDYVNKHINANLRRGIQTYIGVLSFFEDGIEYKAKAANANINFGKILYSNIVEIKSTNTFGIVPNGILLKISDGQEFNFIVNNRKTVMTFLNSKIN